MSEIDSQDQHRINEEPNSNLQEDMASSSSQEEASKSSALISAASSTEDEISEASEMVIASRQTQHGQRKSLLKRIWSIFSIFGFLFHSSSNEDFEKRLQNLSKEEA
eukprot:c19802_g2_i1 orf=1-318(-)